MGYLDLIDGILRGGAHRLGEEFARAQRDWIECHQGTDGGFSGRRGSSDSYYTDFALRGLDLVASESAVFETTARHLQWAAEPADLIGAFSLLSCARTLSRRGHTVSGHHRAVRRILDRESLDDGGFRADGSHQLSAYRSFLGALCQQFLGDTPLEADTLEAISSLQRECGGFTERPDESEAQTNATSAAVALLLMGDGFEVEAGLRATQFLISMQSEDGGLRAHPDAVCGDMLSTFTGLLTLCLLGSQGDLDLPRLARFIRGAAHTGGGFGSAPGDVEADVEYSYYGIASLALIHAVLEVHE